MVEQYCFMFTTDMSVIIAYYLKMTYSMALHYMVGARSSHVGWGMMLQTGRSPVRVLVEVDFFNLPNPSSHTMALGWTQPLTEMSKMGKKQPARRADNHSAICEPNICKLWEPQPLTTLRAATAHTGIAFPFYITTWLCFHLRCSHDCHYDFVDGSDGLQCHEILLAISHLVQKLWETYRHKFIHTGIIVPWAYLFLQNTKSRFEALRR
jgi:hypothetical protein